VKNELKFNQRMCSEVPSNLVCEKTDSTTVEGTKIDRLDSKNSKKSTENIIAEKIMSNGPEEQINKPEKTSEIVVDIKKVISEYNQRNNVVICQSEFTILQRIPEEEEEDVFDLDQVNEFNLTKKASSVKRKTLELQAKASSEGMEDFDGIEEIRFGERIHRIETACERIIVTDDNKVIMIKNKF